MKLNNETFLIFLVCRLQSPTIRRDERLALGSPGQYLSWKVLPASDAVLVHSGVMMSQPSGSASSGDSAQPTRISPIACKVAAVHKEAGADPYFTITMDHTGDTTISHELQVEWPK